MKRLIFCAFFVCYAVTCEEKSSETVEVESKVAEQTIDHKDSIPSVIQRRQNEKKEIAPPNAASSSIVKDRTSLSLVCYKNGVCQVKDVRAVTASPGMNRVVISDLYPGALEESLSFRTPKSEKVSVISYEFCKKNMSREDYLLSTVGNEIFFRTDESAKFEKGKLLNILKGEEPHLAVIECDQRCFLVPIDRCVAVSGDKMQNFGNNDTLLLCFESPNSGNIDLEINYLILNINWKHVCIVNVFDQLNRVDIFSEALLKNNTDSDLENVNVTFDFFVPSIEINSDNALKNSSIDSYTHSVNMKKNSSSMCVLKEVKEQKPKLEYIVKIPEDIFHNDAAKEVSVGNLLIIENANKLGIGVDITDSELLIFRQVSNERNFMGRYNLSSFIKNDALVLEIGAASDIIALAQQTDFRKLSEKQSECGVRVSLQNNKTTESAVTVVVDTNSSWKVTKKNFDMLNDSKPSWKISLKPNESRELHFRIRVNS
ncbi:MAG: hypothetical protein LBB21_07140 [Holosporaceae bacterium]|jgi:hypothetical protein|nr:hypothetical protein [Holosporaceae bacterium]